MKRDQLIDSIKKDIALKRKNQFKHHSFMPVKSLLMCISFIILAFTIHLFMQYFKLTGYWITHILGGISFGCLAAAFTCVIIMLSYIIYTFLLIINKNIVFNIEPFLSEFNDDDLVILQNELEKIKVLDYNGELLCLKDTVVITNKKESHCISLHELHSIYFAGVGASVIQVIFTYQQIQADGKKKKIEVYFNKSRGKSNWLMSNVDISRMKKENDLFRQKVDNGHGSRII